MAQAVVNFLLNQLSTLLSQETTLLGELRPSVEFIKLELGSMTAFLRDAEAKMDNSLELQEWIKRVREVAFDVEDVLDDFSFHFARNQSHGFCGHLQKIYRSIKTLRARHRISAEIKNLKARVEDISARHQRYPARASSPAIATNADFDILATSLLIEEAQLVGIDKPKRELVSQILDDDHRLKVISVMGMGGLGKTTLVRKVYDDAAVKKQFQSHAWLTISQTFQPMVSLKELIQQLFVEIKQLVPLEARECADVLWLSAFVKDFLQDRRYILVLDDVWSTNSWDAIKYVLPDCYLGGRVILTTRIDDVALASCLESHYHVHRMEHLSEEDSWTLFCNRIFKSSQCPPRLEDGSRRILRKCGGLPLAIVAICGVLALKDKNKMSEWEMILHSLGGEPEGSGKLDQIRKILLLSYNDLPHYLKSCLLYLCIFPEDYEISLDDLILRWIALGFVGENNEISAVDIARRYAKELVSRSLIQVASIAANGTFESFRVHDFLREIIAQKSREQNFGALATGYYPRRSEKVRLLAIYDFVDNAESQELNDCLKSVRSLQFFGDRSRLSAPVLSKFLRGCSKKVKVLDLSEAALEDLPGEVFKLFHLKYLCLENTEVKTLPKSIGKLKNLEFLDFTGTKVTELPIEILMLRKLRFLEGGQMGNYSEIFSFQGIKFPRGIRKLLSLEYLGAIEADDKEIVREIGKLTKLRDLLITKLNREDGKELLSCLEKLTNLETLMVASINEDEPIDLEYSVSPTPSSLGSIMLAGHLGSVPKWVIHLDSLTVLYLRNSGLKEDDVTGGIEALQVLPNLTLLGLNHAYEGKTLFLKAGGFQKLKKLLLVNLERLKWVRLEKDSMPSLEQIIIAGCKLVGELPSGIENLTNLKSFALNDMCDELVERVKNLDKESEEYRKIAHIPEVVVAYWKNGKWEGSFL